MAGDVAKGRDANLAPATSHHARAAAATHLDRWLLPNISQHTAATMSSSSSTQKLFRVSTLLRHHKASHPLAYWLRHSYTSTIKRDGTVYCVCESCQAEMIELVEQWERDFESRSNALYEAANRFLGLDPDEEWRRRST